MEVPVGRHDLVESPRGQSADSGKARSSTPIPLDQFVDNLTRSGLMPPEEVTSFQSSFPPKEKPGDGQTLAQRLVEAGKLTAYQAEQICRGETQALAFGEYVVLDHIGEGGMGQVLKAEHRTMRRLVALKMISPKLVDSAEAVKRFHREVRAAAKLEHPNIVTAYDASEHEGVHYLVTGWVRVWSGSGSRGSGGRYASRNDTHHRAGGDDFPLESGPAAGSGACAGYATLANGSSG